MVWLGAGHKRAHKSRKKLGIVFLGLLAAVVMIAAGFLLSRAAAAEETTVVSRVNVTVPAACTLAGSGEASHNANMMNGQYRADIGTTILTATCNDVNGYAIYAIGFSNDEYGNTKMLSNVDAQYDFNTGLYVPDNSLSTWSMKLATSGTSYVPTIENNFDTYHVVPTSYTKVASYSSGTDVGNNAVGSKLTTTYDTYVSRTQAAGTYAGKVKYVLVHPADAVPNMAHTTAAGKIGYYPNGNGMVVDTMGDQTVGAGTTNLALWPSNFQRPGYGFAGWNDKFDMSGTNYGPMESITTPDLTSEGLSLYAKWVKSAGTMQNWTGCSSMSIGDVTALTDARDNNTYAVAKLADGKCWMIENLRLENTNSDNSTGALAQGYNSSFVGLAGPETANFTNSTTANSLYSTDGSTTKTISGSSQGYRFPRYRNDNTKSTVTNMTGMGQNIYSYGNYYTWAAVIADTTHYNTNSQSVTNTSICPKGWHLPTGGTTTASEFGVLSNAMGGYKNESGVAQTMNSSTTPTGAEMSKALRAYPNNFLFAGNVNIASVHNRGIAGDYWSSTVNYNNDSYDLTLYISSVYPGTNYYYKNNGLTARCLIGS